ncbi:cytochrome P450 714C2-like [Euphorbia lathyris]|uniref:cytochrome P450 714C2-like n=1 Tax=Euphorbia lathyris TaxID=212925 RepID=UPI00331405BE
MENIIKVMISILVIGFLGLVVRLYNEMVAKPAKLRAILKKQGINGPAPCLFLGNIKEIKSHFSLSKLHPTKQPLVLHNCSSYIFSCFQLWKNKYGPTYVFSLGNLQVLYVNQPEMVKEITKCTCLDFGKPTYQQKERGPLLGHGILTSNGNLWSHQRKILAPQLYMDKVKGMVKLIAESSMSLVDSWKSRIEKEGGISSDFKIDDGLRSFSGDVISRACFGSSYSKGEMIFLKLRSLQESMSNKSLSTGIPVLRHVPTKSNREIWALEKEIRHLILGVAKERREGSIYDDDLLQMVVEGAKNSSFSQEEMERFIVDNCKNIYLAGYETTAVSATWTLMLLAANQEWQARVRADVVEICGDRIPDYDMLRKMKQLNMVIQESLRLYPPVTVISREALNDMKLGNIKVPKGLNVWTLVLPLHTDPDIWGEDSYKFNPERFENGISRACKYPFMYMPFGVGPRICLGQNLAMVELKILIALILTNFSFSISPHYVHSPVLRLVIEPEHGLDLVINKL